MGRRKPKTAAGGESSAPVARPPAPRRPPQDADAWGNILAAGKSSGMTPAAAAIPEWRAVRTRLWDLNYATLVGGVPVGCLVVVHGKSTHGKSELAYEVMGSFIRAGGFATLLPTEHAEDPTFLQAVMGDEAFLSERFVCPTEEVERADPDTGEVLRVRVPQRVLTLQRAMEVASSHFQMSRRARATVPDYCGSVLVIDTLDPIEPEGLLQHVLEDIAVTSGARGEMSKAGQRSQQAAQAQRTAGNYDMRRAGMIGPWIRSMAGEAAESDTTVVIVTHETPDDSRSERVNRGGKWVEEVKYKPKGGNALFLMATMIARVEIAEEVRDADKMPVANRRRIEVYKNKAGRLLEARRSTADFYSLAGAAGVGLDTHRDALEAALKHGAASVRGSHYYLGERKIAAGKEQAVQALRQDDELFDLLVQALADDETRTRQSRRMV